MIETKFDEKIWYIGHHLTLNMIIDENDYLNWGKCIDEMQALINSNKPSCFIHRGKLHGFYTLLTKSVEL